MAVFPNRPIKEAEVLAWAQATWSFLRDITPQDGTRTTGGSYSGEAGQKYWERKYHFEVLYDFDYTPSSTERRLAVRGGTFTRNAADVHELEITAPAGASPDFGAAGGATVDDLAIADDTMAHDDVWIVYLALYDDNYTNDFNSISPTDLVVKAEKGTVGSPPSRPTEPKADNIQNWSRVLATVTNDNGTLKFEPHWPGGNIKDFELIPDGEPMDISDTPRAESLNYVPAGSEQTGHLQLLDAHTLDTEQYHDAIVPQFTVGPADPDDATLGYYFPCNIEGSPRNNWDGAAASAEVLASLTDVDPPPDSYATIEFTTRDLEIDRASLDILTESGPQEAVIEVGQVDKSIIVGDDWPHNHLDYLTLDQDPRSDAEGNTDQDWRYAVLGADYDKIGDEWGCWFASIGYGTGTWTPTTPELRISLARNELYDDAELEAIDCTDRWLIDESVDTVVAWGGGDLELTPTDDWICDIGDDWGCDVGGLVDMDVAGEFTLDAVRITLNSGAPSTITIDANIDLDALDDVHLDPTGDLLINTNIGYTLADGGNNIVEKGIFVNDAPVYSVIGIRAIPAGGGVPFNMNVIGRVT